MEAQHGWAVAGDGARHSVSVLHPAPARRAWGKGREQWPCCCGACPGRTAAGWLLL